MLRNEICVCWVWWGSISPALVSVHVTEQRSSELLTPDGTVDQYTILTRMQGSQVHPPMLKLGKALDHMCLTLRLTMTSTLATPARFPHSMAGVKKSFWDHFRAAHHINSHLTCARRTKEHPLSIAPDNLKHKRLKMPRKYPNIILTGTPGVGKTTTAQSLIDLSKSDTESSIPLTHLSINKIAKQNNFYESYDAELQTHVVDEDKLLDHIEALISDGAGDGGYVIDWHVCDIFPERWVDLVVVLRCQDTKVFYERLTEGTKGESGEERAYEGQKLQENIDAEIFGVIAEEAKEGWPGDGRVVELDSVEAEQIEENAERIWEWCKQWVKDNSGKEDGAGE